jgi:hypothetical protein
MTAKEFYEIVAEWLPIIGCLQGFIIGLLFVLIFGQRGSI